MGCSLLIVPCGLFPCLSSSLRIPPTFRLLLLTREAVRHEPDEGAADLLALASGIFLHPGRKLFHCVAALRCRRRKAYLRCGRILRRARQDALGKPSTIIEPGGVGCVGRDRRAELGQIAGCPDAKADSRLDSRLRGRRTDHNRQRQDYPWSHGTPFNDPDAA